MLLVVRRKSGEGKGGRVLSLSLLKLCSMEEKKILIINNTMSIFCLVVEG